MTDLLKRTPLKRRVSLVIRVVNVVLCFTLVVFALR